jgi:hypothetical protein
VVADRRIDELRGARGAEIAGGAWRAQLGESTRNQEREYRE